MKGNKNSVTFDDFFSNMTVKSFKLAQLTEAQSMKRPRYVM